MSVGDILVSANGSNANASNAKGSNERERRMRARNRALLAVLLGLVALFYAMAIVRMSGG